MSAAIIAHGRLEKTETGAGMDGWICYLGLASEEWDKNSKGIGSYPNKEKSC
jgi:hypothetical protein